MPSRSLWCNYYNDVIMGAITSQITSLTIVYSIVYSDADQRKHQSSASLAFERGIHRGPVNSPHKWPVTQKMFPFDDVIMCNVNACCLCQAKMRAKEEPEMKGASEMTALFVPDKGEGGYSTVEGKCDEHWHHGMDKQRVLMHRHQGWNVRHGLCHIYMRYIYIYELFIAFVCFVVCSLL